MNNINKSNFKLGIISGGQLGKMLIQEASKWDISTYILDAAEDCPAAGIATQHTIGHQLNFDDVYNFGQGLDMLTYEMESINIEALHKLKAEGLTILPDPCTLELIQDKGLQKNFYAENEIPTAPYALFDNKTEIITAIENGEINFPFVQKLRKGGYDGRGVAVIKSEKDLDKLFDSPSIVEKMVDISNEIAVIAARNAKGEVRCFPVVEMAFDPEANLVEKLLCPAAITPEQTETAITTAAKLIELLGMSGLLAVEFFIDNKGDVVLNEVAPRPHNSGHHTIESMVTSQFEQHIRAILNLPLGSTQQIMPAVMINLLGEQNHSGAVYYEGLEECMAIDGVNIHLYGKKTTQPSRKMGHVTIISDTLASAIEKADKVKNILKVKSWNKN